jgi:hypothetical protein
MAIPLILSAFTHLFNPLGFPCVHYDEGVYMRRAMHILEGLGAQDPESRFDHGQVTTSSYDHPYFGPLFLASVLGAIGYPDSLNLSSSSSVNPLNSIEMLYLVPRVLMGILAVIDTFLVYKIAERRYNRNVAVIASVLFAVMPLSWLIRRVYLDTILTPFLLSSILFALYSNTANNNNNNNNNNNRSWSKDNNNNNNKNNGWCKSKTLIPILLSGSLLGLAIFTKVPAFTMIPLVGFLIYTNNTNNKNKNKNLKVLGIWFIPVILIPLIWPAYSISQGQFDEWLNGVLWQGTERQESTLRGIESHQILGSLSSILGMDPVLVIVALMGIMFAAIKRDFFLLLWLMPFLIFSYLIGWISYFHYILVLPAFCIAAANMLEDIPKRIIRTKKRIQQTLLSFTIASAIGIFGLISTIILITTNNFFPSQFEAAAFVIHTIQHNSNNSNNNVIHNDNKNDDITMISSPLYSWIFKYVFDNPYVFHTRDSSQIQTKKIILMVDDVYRHVLSKTEVEDTKQIQRLHEISNNTNTIASFRDIGINYNLRKYPYTNVRECAIFESNEVKTNY